MPPPPCPLNHDGESLPPLQKLKQKFQSIIVEVLCMLIVTFALTFLFPLISVVVLVIQIRERNDRSPSSGFSSKQLRKLPQLRFSKKTAKTYFEPECVFCLEGFKKGQWCRKLDGCGHLFHRKCVDVWLVKTTACPVCRRRVSIS